MISVIIPVYNAAAFVEEAVQSALNQTEVSEVIIIEDGSADNSLPICEKLAAEYPAITLFRHPSGANKGAGASRNLGIQHAKNEWIAFLDADDYFLNDRFKTAIHYIQSHPDIDALGEPIGAVFHDEKGKRQFLNHLGLSPATTTHDLVTKVNIDVPAKNTFETLLLSNNGSQSIIGLLVHQRVFQKTGPISETLTIAQDSNFLLKLAYSCNFKCLSNVPPIAIRRIHSGNRWNTSTKKRLYYHALHLQDLYNFVDPRDLSRKSAKKMIWYFIRSYKIQYFQTDNKVKKMYFAAQGFFYLLRHNRLLLSKAYL